MKPWLAGAMLLAAALITSPDARAGAEPAGLVTMPTRHAFTRLVERLETAIKDAKMLVVAKASASAGAAGRGITIPGDTVLMVFRNDFAVRMLKTRPSAGIEAPIPIHVYETGASTATIGYRLPSTIFRPYGEPELDRMALELDTIFEQIVRTAAGEHG